jgi:hypothetical protein
MKRELWSLFDKGSISITTLDPDLYVQTMGQGRPPSLAAIERLPFAPKINIVLCPETVSGGDWLRTVDALVKHTFITDINLREPYGQPRIGDPFPLGREPDGEHFGMPFYDFKRRCSSANRQRVRVTYWDVHYVEVESVNLYANGRVSETYPITKGHSENGIVQDQGHFQKSGRVRDQWLYIKKAS